MAGVEWSQFSTVALDYYRLNATDDTGSKRGNNWLAGLGFAYTPVDEGTQMISLQIGLAAEVHDPDVIGGANGTTASSSTPVGVSGLSGATAISVGIGSACTLQRGKTSRNSALGDANGLPHDAAVRSRPGAARRYAGG
jgi:hypothetical protein